ncbi:hypothetical protein [Halolamina sp.]|jgi:hypothetical protein|uniref:hypothetical protein n=1 Tax=Halolamina sp. TaxID=1940283 RepID=UPI000223BE4F|nr:hypothetical protein Halar_3283 [halophilic archaeon DL31]
MSHYSSDGDPEGKIDETHVGKPVLTTDTVIIGTATGVVKNAYTVEAEPGADFQELSMGLVDSGDGKMAVLPGQIERITEDGIYLK